MAQYDIKLAQTQEKSTTQSAKNSTPLLQSATAYAKMGFRLIPIPYKTKSPLMKGWVDKATDSRRTLHLWFQGKVPQNMGVATGKRSGIVVLDVDIKNDSQGEHSLNALVEQYGPLPDTPRVRTGSGGLHYFFAYPAEGNVPTVHATSRGQHPLGAGLDLQSDGAQVVLPPSIHPNGNAYKWEVSPQQTPFAPLPDWLYKLVTEKPSFIDLDTPPVSGTNVVPLYREQHYAQAALQRETEAVVQAPKGTRNNTLNTACVCLGGFIPTGLLREEQIVEAMLQACQHNGHLKDKGRRATLATIQSGLKKGKTSPRHVPDRSLPSSSQTRKVNPSSSKGSKTSNRTKQQDWMSLLFFTDKGKLLDSLHNTQILLTHDPRWNKVLGYDERADQVFWLSAPPWQADTMFAKRTGTNRSIPRELEDEDISRVSSWMKMYYGVDFRVEHLSRAVAVAAKQYGFDPVRDYLESLQWDGNARLEGWLGTYLGAEPTALVCALGQKWMISAVARTYQPGCKVDHMLVLEGEQGIGKSSALRILFSPKWFTDELPEIGSKDAGVHLQGAFCVEFSELEGLSKREVCAVKAFLSRSIDRYRAPYAKSAKNYPRRCVFAATTNEERYLRDSTGNRRFWPVQVGRQGPLRLDALKAERNQLWAEAVHRYKGGEAWHLTAPALLKAVQREQADRYERDEWETVIADYCKYRDSVTTAQLMDQALEIRKDQWTRANQMRLAAVLRRIGWVRRYARDGNQREWRYYPPSGG